MKNHISIIIFGITGDLAKRKLIPALYHLVQLSAFSSVSIIGVGHQQITIEDILNNAQPYIEEMKENSWQSFVALFTFFQCDITNKTQMEQLAYHIADIEKPYKTPSNRLFYFAVASTFFAQATKLLHTTGLCKQTVPTDDYWHRLVYEKPFGHDLISACTINEIIKQTVNESQIFRIDHYLTKDVVYNITLLRFSNIIFEPLWNHTYIEEIHIVLHESLGIQNRGAYYDAYGVLKDVVQNHILQIIALIGMDRPATLEAESIRTARLNTIKHIVFEDGLLGQYARYTDEPYVAMDSKTPTYALLKCFINTPQWQNTPFFISAGKKMANAEVGIHIKFKKPKNIVAHPLATPHNWLTIQLSPDAIFSLQLNVQNTAQQDALVPVDMVFCHSCLFGTRKSQAYETLLQDVIAGKIESAVRYDEIEAAWRIIDSIENKNLPLFVYEPASFDKEEAIFAFKEKHTLSFKSKK
jgi:glucose-6-phosphate 1-dehydrogenase